MISLPTGTRVWLATGHTDMRKGFDGLALLVQETLRRDPHSGHLFVFRGRRGDLIKVLWHDGQTQDRGEPGGERGRRRRLRSASATGRRFLAAARRPDRRRPGTPALPAAGGAGDGAAAAAGLGDDPPRATPGRGDAPGAVGGAPP